MGGALRQFKSCPADFAGNLHGYNVMSFKYLFYLRIITFKRICMKTFDHYSVISFVHIVGRLFPSVIYLNFKPGSLSHCCSRGVTLPTPTTHPRSLRPCVQSSL